MPAWRRGRCCCADVDWRRLRQVGFLTLALVLAGAVLVMMMIPSLDLRGALVVMALVALLLGWVP